MKIHHEIFNVRYSECDAYGHLNNSNYLRWIKDATMRASMQENVIDEKQKINGQSWMTVGTFIEYLFPLTHGQSGEVVVMERNVNDNILTRNYRIVNRENGRLAAMAETIDMGADGACREISKKQDQAIYIAFPSGSKSSGKWSTPFFESHCPPNKPFSFQREVEWRDINGQWMLDDALLLSYMEDAGVRVCNAHGWPVKRMADEGFGLIARQHRIESHARAELGDSLEITTWFSDVKASTVLRHYTIHRLPKRELIARSWTRWVWLSLTTGRPIRAPRHFLKDFEANRSPAA